MRDIFTRHEVKEVHYVTDLDEILKTGDSEYFDSVVIVISFMRFGRKFRKTVRIDLDHLD